MLSPRPWPLAEIVKVDPDSVFFPSRAPKQSVETFGAGGCSQPHRFDSKGPGVETGGFLGSVNVEDVEDGPNGARLI